MTNILPKGFPVANRFEIQFPIGSNSFVQSYRVKDTSGKVIRLDLINLASLSSSYFDEKGELIHLNLLKRINHNNIPKLLNEGETIIEKQKYAFLAYEFISGETLTERLKREGTLSPYTAIPIIIELLKAIEYLHNQTEPVIHNGINLNTIKLDYTEKRDKPVLIGFEQARTLHQDGQSISKKYLSVFHAAPELLNGVFIPQSDLFSIGAVLYHLVFGVPPYYDENILNQPVNKQKALLEAARNKPLSFSLADENLIDEHLKNTLIKSLSIGIEERFQTAEEFSKALNREVVIESQGIEKSSAKAMIKKVKKKGAGFDQVAGMDELKSILYNEVIRPITERERFERFGIPMLNGMLLYGPPGCGKTFIAERLAEEVGFNFITKKPDDLGSPYVHGGQEKIGNLFKEATEKSPCVIFLDEIDAIVPSREGDISHHYAAEVNVMLAHMTECGEKGIFIIAATNRPEKIDKAILRAGRIDKIVYLPPPDIKAREEMFKLYLKSRPIDLSIDYEKLASITDNYVSRDLKEIIIESSKAAEQTIEERITMQIMLDVIKKFKPTVSFDDIKKYESIRDKFENKATDNKSRRKPLGFHIPKNE